jgi:hypothetical protein
VTILRCVPAPSPWRDDASPNLVVLAVGKCLGAVMDASDWTALGLLTSTRDELYAHPRLFRSLRFGDDDYQAAVFDVTPVVLAESGSQKGDIAERFSNLGIVSSYAHVPEWLKEHEPAIYSQVCSGAGVGPDATLPDGTVLDAAETAAGRLGVAEMRRQVDRIRRDYVDDPEALIGQVKELVESVCKTILGLTGTGPETKQDVPVLVAQTLRHLGLHPEGLPDDLDPTEARAIKRVFGGLTAILQGAAELRNVRGTGHGRSGVPLVTPALARLTAGMALSSVVYLCEAYESSTGASLPLDERSSDTSTPPVVMPHDGDPFAVRTNITVGTLVTHATFGEGEVISRRGYDVAAEAEILFAQPVGPKRILLRYAPIKILRWAPEPPF